MFIMKKTATLCLEKRVQESRRDILVNNQETCVRIPMIGDIRSLNLSNSVAIVLYEALRQNNFDHMNLEGHLRNYDWK